MQRLDSTARVAHLTAISQRTARYLATKRALDVVLSLITLILSLPILAVACLAIMIETPGSPIFSQTRIGAFGRPFKILKLRTMRCKTEHFSCVTMRDDPRVTRVGMLLRATKIDELPQLINILLGEMSIVGPRPLSQVECERIHARGFEYEAPGFVPIAAPGLIGLEQISRDRNHDYAERFRLNALYEANHCLRLDAEIVCRALIPCRAVIYALLLGFFGELAIATLVPAIRIF